MEKIWLKHYQQGVPAEINADAYSSVVELFQKNCEKFKNLPAFRNFGSELSYQQLADLSRAFTAYLQHVLRCQKGERIAIMLPNILQYPVILFGALQAGLIVVNVNPLYTVRELVHQVNDAGAEVIIVLANFAHVVQAALPQTGLKQIIVTEVGDLFSWPKSLLTNFVVKHIKKAVPKWFLPQALYLKQALASGRGLHVNPVTITSKDPAFLQYTGGTTGVAKGAILTHRNMVANVEQMIAWAKPLIVEGKEVVITAMPLYHIFSLTVNCLTFIQFGAMNVLITNPRDIAGFVRELAKVPFSILTGVNTLFNALLNHPNFAQLNFRHLKLTLGGGMAVQHAVAERWRQVTGHYLLEGYGLTETSPVVTAAPLNRNGYKEGIGLPIPSTEVMFRNEAGQEVPLGMPGELCVKGPQVMPGYWQHPTETQKIFTSDGWLLTGDIGRMDEEGFIYLLERKKDMILVSGFNVYPSEIEDIIASYPGVQEVAVVGIPDAKSGEVVKAFVVRKDTAVTEAALMAYCRTQLTGYKRPQQIEFRDSLPKSPVGKILRRLLREEPLVELPLAPVQRAKEGTYGR